MSYLSSWLFLLKSRWMHTWITEPTFLQIGYMLHTLSVLINTTENTPLQFSQMLKQMVKWKKIYIFLIWTIFTSLHDKNYCTHFSYCLHPSLLSLPLSRVFWPAAVAANRRALLMKVLKESGKWQRKKKNVADSFLLPNTHRFRAPAKRKETVRGSVPLVSGLCLFLAAALLLSVDRTSGVGG